MRSLRYRLWGRPVTLEDCLDLARRSPAARVRLDLLASESWGELGLLTQLLAVLSWEFADRRAVCEVVCAAVWDEADPVALRQTAERANRRLANLARRIRSSAGGAEIESDQSFLPGPPWVRQQDAWTGAVSAARSGGDAERAFRAGRGRLGRHAELPAEGGPVA